MEQSQQGNHNRWQSNLIEEMTSSNIASSCYNNGSSSNDARNAIVVDSFPNTRKRPHDAMAVSQQPQQSTDVTLAWELLRVVAQQNEENQSNSNNNNAMANGPSQNAFASLIGQQPQQQVGNVETRAEGNGPLGTTADAGAGLVGSNMAGPQEQQQQAVTASAAAVANEGGTATGGGAVPLWSHQPVINCLAVMLLLQRLEQLQAELTEQTSQYNNLANTLSGIQENLGQSPVVRGGNNGAVAATGGVNVNSDTNTSNAYESSNRGIQCNANRNATDTTVSATALNNNIATHFSPATTSMDMVIQASQQQDPSAMLTALVAEIALTSQKQRQQQRMIGSLQEQIDTLRRPAPVAAQQQEQQRQLQEQHPNLHPLLQRLIQMQPPSNSQQQQPSSQPEPPTRPQQSLVHSLIQFILEEQQRQQQFQQEPSLQVNGLAAHFALQQQQAKENQQKGINGDDARNRNNDIMDDPDGISVAASVNNAMPKVPLFINVPRNPWKRYKNQYSHRRQRRCANDRLRQQHGGPPVAHVVPPTRSTSSNASTASADVAVPYPSTATRTLYAAEASTSNKDRDVLVTAASLIQLHASSTDGSPGETDGSSGEDSPGSNSSNDDSPLTGVGNSGSSSDEAHDTNTTDEDNDEKHQKRELQRYSPSSLSNDAYKKVLAASKERRDADGDKDDDETKIIMPPPRLDMEMVSSLQDAASSASSASSLSMESTVDLVILD